MTDLDQRRAVLLARIEAHRTILDLEARYARAALTSMQPFGAVAGALASGMRLATGRQADAVSDLSAALPLLVAAVLRIIAGRHHDEPERPAPPANQPAA